MTTITEEIMNVVNKMTESEQRKILAIVKGDDISSYGIPLSELIERARKLNMDPRALDEMEAAIDAAFEQIDEDDIEPLD